MLRWLALGAGLAFVSSACALDLGGLGADVSVDGGAPPAPQGDGAAVSADDAGGSSPDSSSSSGGSDATSLQGPDAQAGSDASVLEASAMDAPATPDAAPEAGPVCDQDGDGHKATGGACGGDDCCDQDPHVHPGQSAYSSSPGACGGFDFDCDGKESPQYTGASCQWSTFSCSGDGFAAPVPSCGAFGTFTSCNLPWYNVFSCTGSDAQQAQACR